MAKNELLPFADGEDANVLPTNQWEALTDILENGFQSGIARSEQVNRVLAQGAVASYVLGQLIVDQLNKDATLDKDTLYQNLILALQENAKDACLPLSGGTMTGAIKLANYLSLIMPNTSSMMAISGGTTHGNGACIYLRGDDYTEDAGGFSIHATGGDNDYALRGYSDGRLLWNWGRVLTINDIVVVYGTSSITAPSGGTWNMWINVTQRDTDYSSHDWRTNIAGGTTISVNADMSMALCFRVA